MPEGTLPGTNEISEMDPISFLLVSGMGPHEFSFTLKDSRSRRKRNQEGSAMLLGVVWGLGIGHPFSRR